MNVLKKKREYLVAFVFGAAVVLLSACGGGGGGSNDPETSGPQVPETSTTIGDGNARNVAARTTDSMTAALDASSLSLDQMSSAIETFTAQSFGLPRNTVDLNQQCVLAGSQKLTIDDVDNNQQLSRRDRVIVDFDACQSSLTNFRDGTISITFSNLSGDTENLVPPYGIAIDVAFVNFTANVQEQGESFNGVIDGAMSMSVEESAVSSSFVATIESLSVASANLNVGLQDYRLAFTEDRSINQSSVSIDGIIVDESIGTFNVETLAPFLIVGDDVTPSSGVMKISGVASSATLTAIDALNVSIDVDRDGDGVVDATLNTTWDELERS